MMKRTAITTLSAGAIGVSLVFGYVLISPAAYGAAEQCSAGKLKGQYVFSGQGKNLHYGVFNFDGNGKFSGEQTSIRDTPVNQHEILSGVYTLEADCTGQMVMEGQSGGTVHWDVFVTLDGKKGRMIRTDSGSAGVRTFEQ